MSLRDIYMFWGVSGVDAYDYEPHVQDTVYSSASRHHPFRIRDLERIRNRSRDSLKATDSDHCVVVAVRVFIVLVYLQFIVGVVKDICDFLNIFLFKIKPVAASIEKSK